MSVSPPELRRLHGMSIQTRTYTDPGRMTPGFLRRLFGAPSTAKVVIEDDPGDPHRRGTRGTVTWDEEPRTPSAGRHRRRCFGGQ